MNAHYWVYVARHVTHCDFLRTKYIDFLSLFWPSLYKDGLRLHIIAYYQRRELTKLSPSLESALFFAKFGGSPGDQMMTYQTQISNELLRAVCLEKSIHIYEVLL